MFLIARGVVSIQIHSGCEVKVIEDNLGIGLTIGEMSLLKGTARGATVQCQSTVRYILLS